MNRDRHERNRPSGRKAGRSHGAKGSADGNRRRAFIGRLQNVADLADTYRELSSEDEAAALVLQREGRYRQAVYFFLQAMEKLARCAIFSEVSPDDASMSGQTYREAARTHNLDDLLTVLLEAYKKTIDDSRVSEQIEQQMDTHVLQGVYFGLLHNDVRYPRYIERRKSDALLHLSDKDAAVAADKLTRLKAFVTGFQQLKQLRMGDGTAAETTPEPSKEATPMWDFKF